jgi:hypothetical protein
MLGAGLRAICAPCALHWGDAGCDVGLLHEARWCCLAECCCVDVQPGTVLPAALCRLLPGVAGAVLVFGSSCRTACSACVLVFTCSIHLLWVTCYVIRLWLCHSEHQLCYQRNQYEWPHTTDGVLVRVCMQRVRYGIARKEIGHAT